jgi:hypothetical protein
MRNFSTFPALNYIGMPAAYAVQLGAGLRNIVCPLTIPWNLYGAATAKPSIVVNADITGNNVASQMGTVQSVFIDNTGSDATIYVRCLDTNYTICAQPNSEGWYPLLTGLMTFEIVGIGFIDGFISTTLVMFSNLRIIPSQNIEFATTAVLNLASNTISRGTGIQNQNYGIPALGDQISNAQYLASSIGILNPSLWGTPYASGFIYLTHAFIWLQPSSGNTTGASGKIASTGTAGTLFPWGANGVTSSVGTPVVLVDIQKANIKLDATQTWQSSIITTTLAAGSGYNENYVYSWNPN